MIIRSVKLHNIRSYEDETIEFDEGITLLSGDIGSGKSTILLAIEFALFGIMRGGLSGGALLRHGQSKGHVELSFSIDNKKITVRRELKKNKDTISQGSGYIITNGEKFEGTPVELKAKILEIIGYPDELVSKSKLSLFRFTVYTPQEEMKAILYEGNEIRLDTLRRIFNIDKYKRIKENSALLMREMRSEQKILSAKLEGVKDMENKLKSTEKEISSGEQEKNKIEVNIKNIQEKSNMARASLEKLEEKTKEFRKEKNELDILKTTMRNKKEVAISRENELNVLEKETTMKIEPPKDVSADLKEVETALQKTDEELIKIREEEATISAKKEQYMKEKQDISELDNCPLCRQKVTHEHMQRVVSEQDEKIGKVEIALKQRVQKKQKAQEIQVGLNKQMLELREQDKKSAALKEKIKTLQEKSLRKDNLTKEVKNLENEINTLKNEEKILVYRLEQNKDLSKEVEDAKEEFDQIQNNLNKEKIEEARIKESLKSLKEAAKEAKEQLAKLASVKENLDKQKEALNWMDGYFVKIIEVMEKKVMLKIYGEFNEYFMEWFNILMEDETIQVRLDDIFSPIVIQDGYETTVENLSGGEKTATALAYRLSLNKVINDFVGNIKTKELIILDEPTDGFSSEQLDRVREVLKQLNIKQILIVSHETKMESYVDNVVRIVKNDHLSKKNI